MFFILFQTVKMMRYSVHKLLGRNLLYEFFSKRSLNTTSTLGNDEKNNDGHVSRRALKRRKILQETSKEQINLDVKKNENVEKLLDEMVSDVGTGHADLEQFSSDIINEQKKEEEKPPKIIRPKINPESKSFTLFPGQGSQFVGMGKELLQFPGVQSIYDQASEILRYDLLKLCLHGPKSELDKTIYCQPAVFVTSVAAIERLKEENIQVRSAWHYPAGTTAPSKTATLCL